MLFPKKITLLLAVGIMMGACSSTIPTNTAQNIPNKLYVFPTYPLLELPPRIVFNKMDEEAFCLATVIYKEARNQSQKPQLGVAFVAIHRAYRHHGDVSTICEAVFADHQFAWTVKPQISHLRLSRIAEKREAQERMRAVYEQMAWERAQEIAGLALSNPHLNPVKDALYFHDRSMKPKWAHHLQPVARLGAFIFYRDPNYRDPRG